MFYRTSDIARLKIIYMLRQAKCSMSAIHRCLKKFDDGYSEEAIASLHTPNEEDIVWTGLIKSINLKVGLMLLVTCQSQVTVP